MLYEILLYDGFDELDALGPWEILSGVATVSDDVETALVSLAGERPVAASHGAVVRAQRALSAAPDVLVLPGGGWNDRAAVGPGPRPAVARCRRSSYERRGTVWRAAVGV
jgi:putative intracellular protease/amidase